MRPLVLEPVCQDFLYAYSVVYMLLVRFAEKFHFKDFYPQLKHSKDSYTQHNTYIFYLQIYPTKDFFY